MRSRSLPLALAFVLLVAGASIRAVVQSPPNDAYLGTWSGTWDGAGSGQFEMTLEKKESAAAGRVAVTTDNGNYTAELKAIAFAGNKMTAKYDFPLDTSSEILVTAEFDRAAAKGTWSLHAKGEAAEQLGGTWTVTKK